MTGQDAPELIDCQVGCIDDQIGAVTQRGNQIALMGNAIADTPFRCGSIGVAGPFRHGVAPPGFGISLAQHLVIAIKEDQADIQIGPGEQQFEFMGKQIYSEIPGPDIDADGQRPGMLAGQTDQIAYQRKRQIINCLVPDILEYL